MFRENVTVLMKLGLKTSVRLSVLFAIATQASAAFISVTGALDPLNANDGLLISFSLSGTAAIAMQSYGFGGSAKAPGGTNANGLVIAPGGFDTYFSLFQGTGAAANFLVSNDDGSCPPGDDTIACRDSGLTLPNLGAGNYILAVTVFDNFSFAENLGTGSLGDGFIGLGTYFNNDTFSETTSNYAVDIVATGLTLTAVQHLGDINTPVPEPRNTILVPIIMVFFTFCWKNNRRLKPGNSDT